MGIINAECGKTVSIGYQGENKRQRVRIDLSDIMTEFPGGTAVLGIRRPGDSDIVPALNTALDGMSLIWTTTAWELANSGFLYAQVTYSDGDAVGKTKVYRFDVKNSLIVSGVEPEDWQDLVGQLTSAAAALQAVIESYDEMTVEATALPAGSDPTVEMDRSGDHPVMKFGLVPGPAGSQGPQGATGPAGPAGPKGDTGATGARGPAGDTGPQGPAGPKGDEGERGETGATGSRGPKGDKGDKGDPGEDGTDATPALITTLYADLTFPVAAGTMCSYNGLLYKANQAIATSEEWTAAHWTQTTIEAEQSSLKTEINSKADELKSVLSEIGVTEKISPNLFNPEEKESGRITSSSSTVLHTGTYDTDYITTGFIPVEAGKKYGFHYISNSTIVGMAVANIWAYKENKTGLQYLGNIAYNASGLSYVTAPENAKYIRASFSNIDYGTVMVSVVDGTSAPTQIVPYYDYYELEGYVKEDDYNTFKEKSEDIFENNFTDEYSPLTGARTTSKYINANGIVSDIASESYSVFSVDVTPGAKYKITGRAYYTTYYFAFYDSINNFISGLKSTEAGTTSVTDYYVVAPSNASTVVVASDAGTEVVKGVSGQIIKKPWIGKKWVCLGDSLTEDNVATTKHYFDYIVDVTGITPYNMGVGGTGYVRGYDSSKAFYQRISSVPTDADVVTIFGSGNDMNIEAMSKFDGMTWAEALGTYTDATTDTICGCVNATLDAYFVEMVTVPIGIIAPTPWQSYPTTKLTNNRFEDYTNALKQIATYRGVPFLDLYHHSNLRPENEDNRNACFYNGSSIDGNGDGVHPNALGHEIIAPKIFEFVKTMLIG